VPGQDARDGSSLSTSLRPQESFGRRLAGLADLLGLTPPAHDAPLTGVTHDSKAVRPGDLYAALPGSHTHGARFAADAVAAGAVGVLTDETGKLLASRLDVPLLVVETPRVLLGAVSSWIYGEP
jgi:UDP-N-acetylmuramoyl-L-alanyl-D-glutamate--2,6-diaminopimelate ligase